MPISIKFVPSVPDESFYPLEKLQLFNRLNRDLYLRVHGEQAPPWNRERPIKRWFDTEAVVGVADPDTEIVVYHYFDGATKTIKKMSMTARMAATINLPGLVVYPKWTPAPTNAVIVGPNSIGLQGETPIQPEQLSTAEQAEIIKTEIGGNSTRETSSFQFSVDWRGETRRFWTINYRGLDLNVGLLLKKKYEAGYQAPGKWDLTGNEPHWLSEMQLSGEQDPRPEIPIPMRPLTNVERLHSNPFGTMVYRIDKESEFNPTKSGTGGGLDVETKAAIMDIQKKTNNILRIVAGV